MPLFSCAGTRPSNLGVKDARLGPCPSTPNCVSSDAADDAQSIASFQLALPPLEAWRAARLTVTGLPRTKIITETDDYLHAECSSAVFGFVDDLELHLRPAQNLIAVRSAACRERLGCQSQARGESSLDITAARRSQVTLRRWQAPRGS